MKESIGADFCDMTSTTKNQFLKVFDMTSTTKNQFLQVFGMTSTTKNDFLKDFDMTSTTKNHFLKDFGILELRVRHFGNAARIEVNENDKAVINNNINLINKKFSEIGFNEIAVSNFKSGNLNILIKNE